MIENSPSPTDKYLRTLLRYYEEEVSGEAYFYGLLNHFDEAEKITLLAKIERKASEAVQPLLQKYNLTSRTDQTLHQLGKRHVKQHAEMQWLEFMTYIVHRYPCYLVDFKELEAMAPEEDLKNLQQLTEHEVAVIDFARRELANHPDSILPLERYLG